MSRFAPLCFVLSLLGAAVPAPAAVISITQQNAPVTTPDTAYDLNAYGSLDWAYWNSTSNSTITPLRAPDNSRSLASLIGDMNVYNGTLLRGTSSAAGPAFDLTYSNGTSPASGTLQNPIGLFNTVLGSGGVTADAGVQVTVTAPSANPFYVYLWGTAYASQVNLTATIGAATQTNTTYSTASATRSPGSLYTLLVTPDSAGQTLTLNYFLESTTDTANGNVSLSAIAVSTNAIPEPGVILVGALALPTLLLARRWRRRPAQQ